MSCLSGRSFGQTSRPKLTGPEDTPSQQRIKPQNQTSAPGQVAISMISPRPPPQSLFKDSKISPGCWGSTEKAMCDLSPGKRGPSGLRVVIGHIVLVIGGFHSRYPKKLLSQDTTSPSLPFRNRQLVRPVTGLLAVTGNCPFCTET